MVSSDAAALCVCLVFLEAQIKFACISHNSFCTFSVKQCIIKQ